jgi:hypothetical protein
MAKTAKNTPTPKAKKSNYSSVYEEGRAKLDKPAQNTTLKRAQARSKNGKIVTNINQVDYYSDSKPPKKANVLHSKSTSVVDTAGYSKGKKNFPIKKYESTASGGHANFLGGNNRVIKTKKFTKGKISRSKVEESLQSTSAPKSGVDWKYNMKTPAIFKKGGKVKTKSKKK